MSAYDNDVKTGNYNIYSGCLPVSCTRKGKMPPYDLVDIKKKSNMPINILAVHRIVQRCGGRDFDLCRGAR